MHMARLKSILLSPKLFPIPTKTYYCGAQSLFKTHPGIIKNLALLCPNLLPILFDGLMVVRPYTIYIPTP